METNFTEEQKETVLDLISMGEKLEAVKYLREELQLSADDAIALVEKLSEAQQEKENEALIAEVKAATAGNDKIPKLLGSIFGGIGVLLIILAVWTGYRTNAFLERAVPMKGTVIRFEQFQSKDDDGTINTYTAPVIEYQYEGKTIAFRSPYGSINAQNEIGESIDLLIDPEDPRDPEFPSFADQWLATMILGGIGLVFSLVAIIIVRAFR